MGVVTVKSTYITNADTTPSPKLTSTYLGKGEVYSSIGTLAVGAADSAGSLYRFVRVPSGARINAIKIFSDAITGFTSAKVGLYNTQDSSGNAGAVAVDNLFASGVDLSVAQTEPYDVVFNNIGIANLEKRIWEYSAMSLTADPFLFYDVVIKSVTQSGGAGNLSLLCEYVV